MDSNNSIEKALSEYARLNGIDEKNLDDVKAQLPTVKAKVQLLTDEQICEIKKQVGKEKLQELEQILKSVK